MMIRLWGVLIILCGCLLSIAYGQETNFSLNAPDQPVPMHTTVEVSIEKNGHLEFLAVNSQPQGKISMKLIEKVTILSGDYAGWGYAYSEYKYDNLKGVIYFVFYHDQWQGMLSGDLIGVAQQVNGLEGFMTWRVAKVNGADSQGTLDLAFVSYKPGKQSIIAEVWMPVLTGHTLSTEIDSVGHYSGPYEQETTLLILPAPDRNPHNLRKFKGVGLEFGTYEAGMESGTLWSFIENTNIVNPFHKKRFGTRDGALAGTSEVSFSKEADGKTKILGTSIHVTPY